jgi:hypothetical protein
VSQLQHKLAPDELQKSPNPANIIEFAEHMTLKDESGDIELYKIANPHADGMLMAHLVSENIVLVTDLYSPIRDKDRSEMFVFSTRRSSNEASRRPVSRAGTAASYQSQRWKR